MSFFYILFKNSQKKILEKLLNSPLSFNLTSLFESPQFSQMNGVQQTTKPPNVPQRRSQSIPRQAMSQSFATSSSGAPISGVQTLNRPRSLDRYNANISMRTTNAHASPHNQHIGSGGGMKQSITFHGQQMLNQACYQGDIYEEVAQHQKKDRPVSFAYGEQQAYLENQLRLYQEQLKNITESMKKFQEQTRILNELKRQQSLDRQKTSVPMSKSDSKLSSNLKLSSLSSSSSINNNADDQTPSHQLKLFLDNIRNSIKEPSFEDDDDEQTPTASTTDVSLKAESTPTTKKILNKIETNNCASSNNNPNNNNNNNSNEPKTPSDQLRLFLDAIRHNQSIETHQRTDVPKSIPELQEGSFEKRKSEAFSQVTDNIKLLNQDLKTFDDNANITSISKNMDKILDDFNRMASMLKSSNSFEYLQKCSEALKQTTNQLRQLNSGGTSNSSDDSSCSTTPGSIREAVQSLMAQPRNGFQIMDDRMSVFMNIMEQQERFSQVILA